MRCTYYLELLFLVPSLTLDGPAATQELTWLTDVPAATAFIAAAEVALIGFFQVCPSTPPASPPRVRNCLSQVSPDGSPLTKEHYIRSRGSNIC